MECWLEAILISVFGLRDSGKIACSDVQILILVFTDLRELQEDTGPLHKKKRRVDGYKWEEGANQEPKQPNNPNNTQAYNNYTTITTTTTIKENLRLRSDGGHHHR